MSRVVKAYFGMHIDLDKIVAVSSELDWPTSGNVPQAVIFVQLRDQPIHLFLSYELALPKEDPYGPDFRARMVKAHADFIKEWGG